MKKLPATLLLFVLLLSTVAVAVSCSNAESSTNTPEGTVNIMLDAMEDMNVSKMMECMDVSVSSEERDQIEGLFEMMKEMGMRFSITNRNIEVMTQTENTATVSVQCDLTASLMGQTQTQSMDENFELVKVDGKWLLTGFPEDF